MRGLPRHRRRIGTGMALFMFTTSPAMAAPDGIFLLRISGAEETAFEATCVPDGESASGPTTFEGVPPYTIRIEGRDLTCIFRQIGDGNILVDVVTPRGNVSRAGLSGRGSTLTLKLE